MNRIVLLAGLMAVLKCNAAPNIRPFVTCMSVDAANSTASYYFGYESFEQTVTSIPAGAENRIVPPPANRNQPTLFLPGYFEKAFRVVVPFPTSSMVWVFNGFSAILDPSSVKSCEPTSVPSLPPATVGAPYSQQLVTAGPHGPLSWTAIGSFPGGLSLSSDGRINGTPLAGGNFSLSIQVTDGLATSTRTYSLAVRSGLDINDAASVRVPGFAPQFRLATVTSAAISATASCNADEFLVSGGGVCTVPNSNTVLGRIASSAPSGNGWNVTCSGGTASAVAICSLK